MERENTSSSVLAVAGLELALAEAGTLQHGVEFGGRHAGLDLLEPLAEDGLHLALVDLDAVFLGLEHQHVLVDHRLEGLLPQAGQLFGAGLLAVAALL